MEKFVSNLEYTLVAAAILVVLQYFFSSVKQQKIIRADAKTDVFYWLLENTLLGLISKAIIAVFVTFILLAKTDALSGLSVLRSLVYWQQIILILILADFVGYWVHRLMHKGWFWRLHSIHHSSKELDWLSAVRFHPLETVFIISVVYLVVSVPFGYDNKLIGAALTIRSLYGYFVHSNLKWGLGAVGYLMSNPKFHRWHHTMEKEGIDKNFGGFFSIWDYIFGTFYLPSDSKIQPHNFGVKDNVGDSVIKQLYFPFVDYKKHK